MEEYHVTYFVFHAKKKKKKKKKRRRRQRRSSYYEMTTRIDSILQKKNADGAEEATGCDHQKTTFRRRVT